MDLATGFSYVVSIALLAALCWVASLVVDTRISRLGSAFSFEQERTKLLNKTILAREHSLIPAKKGDLVSTLTFKTDWYDVLVFYSLEEIRKIDKIKNKTCIVVRVMNVMPDMFEPGTLPIRSVSVIDEDGNLYENLPLFIFRFV